MVESNTHLSHLAGQLEELQTGRQALEAEVREAGERLVETRGEGSRLNDLLEQVKKSLTQAKERQVCALLTKNRIRNVIFCGVGRSPGAAGQPGTETAPQKQ